MFGRKSDEQIKNLKALIEGLEKERTDLKREVNDLKSQKKIEEEELKHLVKIKDEKREIEYQKKEMELRAKLAGDLATEKDKFQERQIALLDEAKKDMQKVHSEILARLPDIKAMVKLNGK